MMLVDKLADQGIRLRGYQPGEYYIPCPRCSADRKPANRKKPCLSIKLDDNGGAVWTCHNCEWTDNVPGEGRGDYTQPRRAPPAPARQPPTNGHRADLRERMLQFFTKRGISEETVEALGIYPIILRGKPTTVFPYRLAGQVVNNKYRLPGKQFQQDKDALRTLFNVDSLVDNDTCVWTEGEMDVAALVEAGLGGVVSLPDGAPATHKEELDRDDKRYDAIVNCADLLGPIKRFVLAVDNDEPGDNLAHQLALRFGRERCFRPRWPDGCKDPNDVLLKHGPEALVRQIERAPGYPVRGIKELRKGELLEYRNSPRQETIGIGKKFWDDHLTFRPGQVVVVTGWPGDGKSELVAWLAVELARQHDWRFAICSPEHGYQELAAAIAEKFQGLPFKSYGLSSMPMPEDRLEEAETWIQQHFSWIIQESEDDTLSLDTIFELARVCHIRHGIKGLIIDPYNEIEHDRRGMNESEYAGKVMRRLKQFGRNHDCIVFLIAHPSKISRDRDGKRPKPTLQDISGSANFWNKCDIGMTVYRLDYDQPDIEVIVQKVKRKDQGKPTVINLVWDKLSGQYGTTVAGPPKEQWYQK